MSDRMNFNQAVVNYINDNLSFIKEGIESSDLAILAQASLDHYDHAMDAFNAEDEYLSDEQRELFLSTATRLFTQGFVEHAGDLSE